MTIHSAGFRARADLIPPPLGGETVSASPPTSLSLPPSSSIYVAMDLHSTGPSSGLVVGERQLVVWRPIDLWIPRCPGSGPALSCTNRPLTVEVSGPASLAIHFSLIDYLIGHEFLRVAGERRSSMTSYAPPPLLLLSGGRGGEQGSDASRARGIAPRGVVSPTLSISVEVSCCDAAAARLLLAKSLPRSWLAVSTQFFVTILATVIVPAAREERAFL